MYNPETQETLGIKRRMETNKTKNTTLKRRATKTEDEPMCSRRVSKQILFLNIY